MFRMPTTECVVEADSEPRLHYGGHFREAILRFRSATY